MAQKQKHLVAVAVIESERGWGRKVDDHMVCLSIEDGKKWTDEYNSDNKPGPAPDWYMQAEGDPSPIDLTTKQFNALKKAKGKRMYLSQLKTIK